MVQWLSLCGAPEKICNAINEDRKVEITVDRSALATGSSQRPGGAQALVAGSADAQPAGLHWRSKTYYEDGRKYEGQWLGDQRHGRGREESRFGDFIYDGDFKNDQYDGSGIMGWANGSRYVGQFANSLKHGMGKEWYGQGDRYRGEYKNGDIDGRGEYIKADGTSIKGIWSQGQLVRAISKFGSSFIVGDSFAESPPPMPHSFA
eukprot:gnl/MRDRNA2_/MRDRNA2_34853_c0_seq1.p1 gnl/MRDRNA2_/MRDRNA2_34853_c0~~gnl/MRDRNA2_/MRDRNA2_34853_c0_seq1.p1  ORF type:complete len:205 (+),score=40.89 gnl/MRDRNA2_/MRDRNA2_34853_c0_seq1:101-715(+)